MKSKLVVSLSLFFATFVTVASFSMNFRVAASEESGTNVVQESCTFENDSILGLPLWYKYLEGKRDVVTQGGVESEKYTTDCAPVISRNEDGSTDFSSFLPIGLAVLEGMMTLAGLVAVVMIFWGSFNFVLTQGESDKAASARKTVINAAIGLAIVIIATRVVSFIANTITG